MKFNSAESQESCLYMLTMKHAQVCYYGNSLNPFKLFRNRHEADDFIMRNSLGSLWRSTKATEQLLADYFCGNL